MVLEYVALGAFIVNLALIVVILIIVAKKRKSSGRDYLQYELMEHEDPEKLMLMKMVSGDKMEDDEMMRMLMRDVIGGHKKPHSSPPSRSPVHAPVYEPKPTPHDEKRYLIDRYKHEHSRSNLLHDKAHLRSEIKSELKDDIKEEIRRKIRERLNSR